MECPQQKHTLGGNSTIDATDLKHRLADAISRLWWRFRRALSDRRVVAGVQVWTLHLSSDEHEVVIPKLTRALELIAAHDELTHQRLRSYTAGIVVAYQPGVAGSWLRATRLVRLSLQHVVNTERAAEHIATTIAHEAAHAWMEARGFKYDPARRHRIEAICYRSEARLARRLPGCTDLAAFYLAHADRTIEEGPGPWSWESTVDRDLGELEQLGTPQWIRTLVRRLALRGSA